MKASTAEAAAAAERLKALKGAHGELARRLHGLRVAATSARDALAEHDSAVKRNRAALEGMTVPDVPRPQRADLRDADANLQASAADSPEYLASRARLRYVRAKATLEVAEAERADALIQREEQTRAIARLEQERGTLAQRASEARQKLAAAEAELDGLARARDAARQELGLLTKGPQP